jgi:hypothetical protein
MSSLLVIFQLWENETDNSDLEGDVDDADETGDILSCLNSDIRFQADFNIRKEATTDRSVPRFLPNPEENWGPMSRAKGKKRYCNFAKLFFWGSTPITQRQRKARAGGEAGRRR